MTDWHSRWESNKIGWHADQVNQNLIDYFSKLNLVDGDKIFVPLCGKSVDMFYLLKRGLKVVNFNYQMFLPSHSFFLYLYGFLSIMIFSIIFFNSFMFSPVFEETEITFSFSVKFSNSFL